VKLEYDIFRMNTIHFYADISRMLSRVCCTYHRKNVQGSMDLIKENIIVKMIKVLWI